jgi:hypothetical protein
MIMPVVIILKEVSAMMALITLLQVIAGDSFRQ